MKLLALCVAFLSAACSMQLERMKQTASSGGAAANAAETIECRNTSDSCGQAHLLKGDACYGRFKTDPAGSTAQREHVTCAVDELGLGLAAMSTDTSSIGTKQDYARKRLEALHGKIDLRRAGEPSAAPELLTAASTFEARFQDDPAGPYYEASARLTMAQDAFLGTGNKAALCAALPPIEAVRQRGAASPGSFVPNYQELSASLAASRRTGGCT